MQLNIKATLKKLRSFRNSIKFFYTHNLQEKIINKIKRFLKRRIRSVHDSGTYKSVVKTRLYKQFMKLSFYKKIGISIYILFLLYIALFLLFGGYEVLTNNNIWVYFSILSVLIFPNLIFKVAFKKSFISIYSILGLLIYPAAYILIFFLSKVGISDFEVLSRTFFIFIVLLTNVLLVYYLCSSKDSEIKNAFNHVLPISLGVIIYSIVLMLIRQPDSIAALDYIQHQAAINSMIKGDVLCIIPNQCSSLFLKVGYTSFYHTITSVFSSYSGNSLIKTYYVLDFAWASVGMIVLYRFFKNFLKRRSLAGFAAIISLLVFVNGAYDFIFFIPQTLSYYIFLSLLSLKNLNLKILIVGIGLLLLAHFIMGAYLSVILVIYYLFIKGHIKKHVPETKINRYLIYCAGLILAAAILSAVGFSIEQNFQAGDIKLIGSLTNLAYPKNILAMFGILGVSTFLLIVSIYYYFKDKRRLNIGVFAIIYLILTISVYILGPTYANKFLIGYGIFTTILLMNYLIDLRMSWKSYGFLAVIVLSIYIFNFGINYNQYLEFYKLRDSVTSVITPEDKVFSKYLKDDFKSDCVVISDPYSQIMVAGFTANQTAAAQYMSPPSRQALFNFINTPGEQTWKSLLKIDELKAFDTNNVCFLYTSRLEETIKANNTFWITNIYSLIVNNDYKIKELPASVEYLQNRGFVTKYKTENFILLSK